MKDVNYFFLVLCSVLYIGILSACDDKETPAIMNIESVCGNYAVEQVKMTFNGVDMPALGNISLTLDASYDDNVGEVDGSRKMTLEMPPLWPNLPVEGIYPAFENIIVKTYSVKYIFLLRKIKPMVPFFVAFTIKSEIKDQYFIA